MIAFNFCQPLLMNRVIKLSTEVITDWTNNVGYGLIGAYFLVYMGIAVRI
jgi:ATP-binding cassette, subfamily C (CFTR/MRP), member 1